MATVVLTGASDGIGAAAAVMLTQLGHQVVATGRAPDKLEVVWRRMVAAAPDGSTVPQPVVADLADLGEVRRLAAEVLGRVADLDVLANNAGLQTRRRETSPDGFELVLAVNHLAPFLLTNLLADRLRASGGRVVTTSSVVHRLGGLDLDDLQMRRRWRRYRAYAASKLANIWFTVEVTSRLGVPATCYHPGSVDTSLGRDARGAALVRPVLGRFGRTPEQGADTLVWLATDVQGAAPRAVYYQDRAPARTSARARDATAAARLWDQSAELVGL